MKQRLTALFLLVFLTTTVISFTAFTFQEKGNNKNNKKEQPQNKGKGQDKKDNAAKDNSKNNRNDQPGKPEKADKVKNEKDNRGQGGMNNEDRGNKNDRTVEYGYRWDRESFKDRQKFRNQEKVTLCHKFNNDNEPAVTLRVSANALKAHLDHGDVRGECPEINNDRYSNSFWNRRNDYFNTVQNSQEQVLYSRSILDYARERLSSSRLQLATMQSQNVPVAQLQERQAVVVELEENVTLLEALLGVAANLIANKLQ